MAFRDLVMANVSNHVITCLADTLLVCFSMAVGAMITTARTLRHPS